MSATVRIDQQTTPEVAGVPQTGQRHKSVIEIRRLFKSYPIPFQRVRQAVQRRCLHPVEALRNVSFSVSAGEIFGIIGPNGAGKTTLTKIIATLVHPTSGTVRVNDYDSVADEEAVRLQVGLAVAEERSFYWRLTVTQNLMFFARLYGMPDAKALRRIDELLEGFGLAEYAHRRFGELSTGNKQRVGVARALIAGPPVILLDEPTRSLDPMAAVSMRALIRSLAQQTPPVSVLLTSHNLSEVEELCTRVAILSRGQVRAVDTPKNLRTLDKRTERVGLTVKNILPEQVNSLLGHWLDDLAVAQEGSETFISFTREEKDDQLDLALRLLHENGASVLLFETERATLLDVLKSYEHGRDTQERCGTRC